MSLGCRYGRCRWRLWLLRWLWLLQWLLLLWLLLLLLLLLWLLLLLLWLLLLIRCYRSFGPLRLGVHDVGTGIIISVRGRGFWGVLASSRCGIKSWRRHVGWS